jgi:hypothetical protein
MDVRFARGEQQQIWPLEYARREECECPHARPRLVDAINPAWNINEIIILFKEEPLFLGIQICCAEEKITSASLLSSGCF